MPELPASMSLIGLGNMGLPMANQWIQAGVAVHGFDPSESASQQLAELGGHPHASAAEAVAATRYCVLMLPNSAIVDSVLDGLLTSGILSESNTVLDMSSSRPESTVANAQRLRAAGVTFADAPVSGGVRGVVAGSLAIMAGGDEQDVEAARPLLSVLGTVLRVGPVGSGHAAKALNNMVAAAHLWATSEAVRIAEGFGVTPEDMIDVLNRSTGRSVSSEVKWPRFILTEAFDSGFHAALLAKDTAIAGEMSQQIGLTESLSSTIAQLWGEAVLGLPPGADHTEVAKYLEGLPSASSQGLQSAEAKA